MQIGRQENLGGCRARQLFEYSKTLRDEFRVRPSFRARCRLVPPHPYQLRQVTEWMRVGRAPPQTPKERRDHGILLRLRQQPKYVSGFAALEEHCIELLLRFEKVHRRITVPEAQALNLVRTLHVRHADFEDGGGAVVAQRGSHPRATDLFAIEGDIEPQPPPARELIDCRWQLLQPRYARWITAARRSETLGNDDRHMAQASVERVGGRIKDAHVSEVFLGKGAR